MLPVVLFALAGAGCRCKSDGDVVPPTRAAGGGARVSPKANLPATVAPPDVVAWSSFDTTATGPVDAAAAPAKDGGAANTSNDGEAPKQGAKTDARVAAEAAARARATTEKAVNNGLNQAKTRLEGCLRQHKSPSGDVKVSLHVHRGYVTRTNVSGASSEATRCLDEVLRGLKFSGFANDAVTVERTFNYKR